MLVFLSICNVPICIYVVQRIWNPPPSPSSSIQKSYFSQVLVSLLNIKVLSYGPYQCKWLPVISLRTKTYYLAFNNLFPNRFLNYFNSAETWKICNKTICVITRTIYILNIKYNIFTARVAHLVFKCFFFFVLNSQNYDMKHKFLKFLVSFISWNIIFFWNISFSL